MIKARRIVEAEGMPRPGADTDNQFQRDRGDEEAEASVAPQSRMDAVAEALYSALTEGDVQRLADTMYEYESRAGRSLQGLMRIPGFRKLWQAMDEAVRSDRPSHPNKRQLGRSFER